MRYFDFLLEHYAGPKGHDDLLDMEIPWKSEPAVKAFTKLKEWADKGYFPKGFLNTDPAPRCRCSTTIWPAWCSRSSHHRDQPHQARRAVAADYGTFPLPTGQKPLRVPGSPSQFQVNSKAPKDTQGSTSFRDLCGTAGYRADDALAVGFPARPRTSCPATACRSSAVGGLDSTHIGLYRLTDQGLPQEVVAAYFEAQDSMILDAMTPEEAGRAGAEGDRPLQEAPQLRPGFP